MKMLAERIISVLKADTTLVTLIGDQRNIFAKSLNETDHRPSKYICVEASLGEDMNYVDAQMDDIDIEFAVSRNIANSYATIMSIIERADALINKQEVALSNTTWKILDIHRTDSPTRGILLDDKFAEYYSLVRYSYILSE